MSDTREQWLAERRKGIGGSDISAILGVSKYRTPLDVWFDKTGRDAPDASDANEAMRWGTLLEDVVAREWSARTGHPIQRMNAILRHPDNPVVLGSIDRAIVAPGSRARVNRATGHVVGAEGVLEVKTASAHAADQWEDETGPTIPVYYAAQGLWYLGISGLPWAEFAVLVGGQRMLTRRLERDDETIRFMFAKAAEWWQRHVVGDVMPEPVNEADVLRLYPRDSGRSIEADAYTRHQIARLREVRGHLKALEAEAEVLTEVLKVAMTDATTITLEGAPAVTWKASKDRAVTDWQNVAQDLAERFNIPPDVHAAAVAARTATTPGSRRFLLKEQKV